MDTKRSSASRRVRARDCVRAVESKISCPMCGKEGISTEWILHEFDYGPGEANAKLRARVPVRQCGACGFQYLDHEAEQLKHDAVCDHLGVLPPDEIRKIREDHEMTRAVFADVTGLGEASLNRWENGLSVQTHANDRYLRLLRLPQIMQKLQELMASRLSENRASRAVSNRFRVVEVTDAMRKKQNAFRLHRAA